MHWLSPTQPACAPLLWAGRGQGAAVEGAITLGLSVAGLSAVFWQPRVHLRDPCAQEDPPVCPGAPRAHGRGASRRDPQRREPARSPSSGFAGRCRTRRERDRHRVSGRRRAVVPPVGPPSAWVPPPSSVLHPRARVRGSPRTPRGSPRPLRRGWGLPRAGIGCKRAGWGLGRGSPEAQVASSGGG